MFASDTPRASRKHGVHRGLNTWVLPWVLALSSMTAHAQSDKDAEQVKRLRLQMRQVQQQHQQAQEAQAKAEQARLQAEASLKTQEGELDKQRGAASSASRRAAALAKELEALKPEHERTLAELATLKARYEALQASAKAAQAQAAEAEAHLRAQATQLGTQLQRTRADNASLVELGRELLKRYEEKGLGEVFSAKEPFLQVGRVKLENFLAEYGRRIDGLQVGANGSPPPAASPQR